MTTNALFTADELAGWLHMPAGSIAQGVSDMVELVVWGWMKDALGVEARPATLTDQQKAHAVELGGIAYSNPEGLARYALESELTVYDAATRQRILDQLTDTGPPGAPARPRGKFPTRTTDDDYPDPARPYGTSVWPRNAT
jgi:hypothetical protein